jgi:hypothetical protein
MPSPSDTAREFVAFLQQLGRIRVASKHELTGRIRHYIKICNEAPLVPKLRHMPRAAAARSLIDSAIRERCPRQSRRLTLSSLWR